MGIKFELGQKIRRMRIRRGLTQEILAEKVDISQRTLSGIETGENFVTAETLDKLVVALDTTFEELFATEHYKETPLLVREINEIAKNLLENDKRREIEILFNLAKILLRDWFYC